MSDAGSFSKFVPGFDFLQSLVKNAGAALPGIGQWVAPIIDPEELEKRIEELRTVQFWLEQNARMLGTTIQAMEVQRMTLSTLKTMNVQMEDLRESMQIRMPRTAPNAEAPAPVPPAAPAPAPAPQADASPARATEEPAAPELPKPGVVDPLQWWGALTKQFSELATQAMKDTGADAVRNTARAQVEAALAPKAAARKPAAKKRAPAKKRPAAKKTAAPR